MVFRKKETGLIIDLLIMAVLADKKIYTHEIQVLTNSVLSLQEKGIFKEPTSGARILLHFELNKDRLKTEMEAPSFEAWLYSCLEGLKDVPNKAAIHKALQIIALADNELHVSEKALLVLTARYWNLPLN